MELRHLRYFLAVAEELNFTKAAERLNMAQQPLSAQIKQLENELGSDLFIRANNRTQLTPAGNALLPEARAIVTRVEHAQHVTQLAAAGKTGTLRVGFCERIFDTVLPLAVKKFLDERPEVHVDLHQITTSEQHVALERREIDVGFGGTPEGSGILQTRALANESLVAVASARFAAERTTISLTELASLPFVALSRRATPWYRAQLDRIFTAAGVQPRVVQEANDKNMLLGLVRADVGVSILPEHSTNGAEGVAALTISGVAEHYVLSAVWRADDASILRHAFVDAVAREMREQLDGVITQVAARYSSPSK